MKRPWCRRRAARRAMCMGECVLFADVMTDSIKRLIELTDYRREFRKSTIANTVLFPRP